MASVPLQNAEPIEGVAEAVVRAIDGAPVGGSQERRGAKRFAFPVVQMMAQYDRTGLPSRDRFQQVRCQDLSSSGISFLWPQIPDFEYIVISLETSGPPIHLTARVTSVRPAPNQPGELLVGCQFTGRLNTY
jgi:PilZ domain